MAIPTRRMGVAFDANLGTTSLSRDRADDIGRFLLRIGFELRPECDDGTLAGAAYYVTRLLDFHQQQPGFGLALDASTVVYQRGTPEVVAVCMIGGGGETGTSFGIYDLVVDPAFRRRGVARHMIERALSVLSGAASELLLEVEEDNAPALALYHQLGARFTDEPEYWHDEIVRICTAHGLDAPTRILATNAWLNFVFVVNHRYVVKFSDDDPKWFAREVEILERLSAHRATSLRLYGCGRTQTPPGVRYLVENFLPGRAWSEVHASVPLANQLGIAAALGRDVARVHLTPTIGMSHFDLSASHLQELIDEYAKDALSRWRRCHPEAAPALEAYLHDQLATFGKLQPILANNDLHGSHVLVTERDGTFSYSGFIDFGDADCSEVEYELVKVHLDTFRCQAALTNAFLCGYRELRPITLSLDKCKVYSIVHRFSQLGDFLDWEQVKVAPACLREQLDVLWQSVAAG